MYEILMVVYLVIALILVGFILIQQGKGAGMGASFGAGASGTVFGASGSGNFLTKMTTVLAVIFFGVALGLGNLTADKSGEDESGSLFPAEELGTIKAVERPVNNSGDLPVDDVSMSSEMTSEAELPDEKDSMVNDAETQSEEQEKPKKIDDDS